MKKLILFIFLSVILLTGKSFGQGTCQNAPNIYPSDSVIQLLSTNDTIAWYIYNSTTPILSIQALLFDSIATPACEIYIYSGYCNNLILIDTSRNIHLGLIMNSLSIGNTYYIKITKTSLTTAVRFQVKNATDPVLTCGDTYCHDNDNPLYHTPGFCNDLVCNGNFEYCTHPPATLSQIGLACPWGSANDATPDYYSSNSTDNIPGTSVNVPNNSLGYQPDFILGHKAYAGMCFNDMSIGDPDYHEYIYQKLKHKMLQGHSYNVSMLISRAEHYRLAIDNIGVFFSANTPYSTNGGTNVTHINEPVQPQFTRIWKDLNPVPNNYITDNINWKNFNFMYTTC